ncbi:hypothetical protein DSM21852_29880 [Methylocystis bryophila]|uniref:Uncharacterized protein n=1 Tax=Methylocystis bryophila TaxID=655015 RepID=A0A1W6MQI3_9HYPH|nr:hypothetical protein B1812_00800 [Methylocystis bryophila]BDV39735.1 hypothetical protein DSM21852_29880 [Methylocystis bryophila]
MAFVAAGESSGLKQLGRDDQAVAPSSAQKAKKNRAVLGSNTLAHQRPPLARQATFYASGTARALALCAPSLCPSASMATGGDLDAIARTSAQTESGWNVLSAQALS